MNPVEPISDNELILYFYRDGLQSQRVDQIDDALFASTELRLRYTQLQQLLHEVDAGPAIEPDAQFSQRIWQRLATRIATQAPSRRNWLAGWRERLRLAPAPRLAFAASCALALAVAMGYYAGRSSAPGADVAATANAGSNAMAAHVLDAYVSNHLRATEGLLMTAANSDSAQLQTGNRDLAATLVASNRLYALAATRSGNTRLAEFLRQLEPVLLELANQSDDAPVQSLDGLRDYLRKTDLLFQVRATQARIDEAGRHGI